MDYSTDTIGLDIGDKQSVVCVLDATLAEAETASIATSKSGMQRYFGSRAPCLVVMEVGTHSRWISRQLEGYGHEVVIANPRMLPLIYRSDDKDDRNDAERLARVGRLDRSLLKPVKHRSEKYQEVLAIIQTRDVLVRARTRLVTHCRGAVKAGGDRFPASAAAAFHKMREHVPAKRQKALDPVMEVLEVLARVIKDLDREINTECLKEVPEAESLQQVHGVGPITALAFVTTVEDPFRFKKSRSIASYLGLRPRRDQSGGSNPQLRITKAGNPYMRRLLVGSAQRILGPFGADSDLRTWGMKLCQRGGRSAKKRAAVAVPGSYPSCSWRCGRQGCRTALRSTRRTWLRK
jgi:transposase